MIRCSHRLATGRVGPIGGPVAGPMSGDTVIQRPTGAWLQRGACPPCSPPLGSLARQITA